MAYGLRTVGGGLLGAGKAAALGTGAVAAMGLRQAASAVPGGAAAVTMGLGGAAAGLGMIGRGAMKGFRGSGAGAGGAGAGGTGSGAGAVSGDWKKFADTQGKIRTVLHAIKVDTGHIRKAVEDMRALAYEDARKRLKEIKKPKLATAVSPLLLTDQREKEEGGGFPWKSLAALAALGAMIKLLGENLSWVAGVLIAKPWKALAGLFGKEGIFARTAAALKNIRLPTFAGIRTWLFGTAGAMGIGGRGGFFSRIATKLGLIELPKFQGLRNALTKFGKFFAAEGPLATALSKIKLPSLSGITNWLRGGVAGAMGIGGPGGFFSRIATKLGDIKIPGIKGISTALTKLGVFLSAEGPVATRLSAFFAADGPIAAALSKLRVPSLSGITNWLRGGVSAGGAFGARVAGGFFARIGTALSKIPFPSFLGLRTALTTFFAADGPVATLLSKIKIPKIGAAITPFLDDIARFFSAEGPIAGAARYLKDLVNAARNIIPGIPKVIPKVVGGIKTAASAAMGFGDDAARGARTMARSVSGRAGQLANAGRNVAGRVLQTGRSTVAVGARIATPVIRTMGSAFGGAGKGFLGAVKLGAKGAAFAAKYSGLTSVLKGIAKFTLKWAGPLGAAFSLGQAALIYNDDTLSDEDKADQIGTILGEFFGTVGGIKLGLAAGGVGGIAGMLGAGPIGAGLAGFAGAALGGVAGFFGGPYLGRMITRKAMGLPMLPGADAAKARMQKQLDNLTSAESSIMAGGTIGYEGPETRTDAGLPGTKVSRGLQRIIGNRSWLGGSGQISPVTNTGEQARIATDAAMDIHGGGDVQPQINVGTLDQSTNTVAPPKAVDEWGGAGRAIEEQKNYHFRDMFFLGAG